MEKMNFVLLAALAVAGFGPGSVLGDESTPTGANAQLNYQQIREEILKEIVLECEAEKMLGGTCLLPLSVFGPQATISVKDQFQGSPDLSQGWWAPSSQPLDTK